MREADTGGIKVDYHRPGSKDQKGLFQSNATFSYVCSPLPDEMGRGTLRFEQDDEGLGYGELETEGPPEDFQFRVELQHDCFKIPFLLSEDPTTVGIEGNRNDVHLTAEESHVLSPSSIGTALIPKAAKLHLLSFFVPPQRLDEVLDDSEVHPPKGLRRALFDTNGDPYLHVGIVTPALQTVVDQVRSCRMRGSLRHLYIEGKLLELVSLRLQEICEDSRRSGSSDVEVHLRNKDRERIREAMQILAGDIQNPPTLQQLARLVGINMTKLKRGFRCELGVTVFGYLHRLRMEQALLLLRETDMNVAEVAWEVGYSSQSAFSWAFRKDFGFSPSKVLRRED